MSCSRLFAIALTLALGLSGGAARAQSDGGDGGASDGAAASGPRDGDMGSEADGAADAADDGGPPRPAEAQPIAPEVVEPTKMWTGTKLVVATKEAPPFSMKRDDGSWHGLSIELWERAAEELEVEFELRETDIPGMVEGLQDGTYDAAVAAMTVTAEREAAFDFSHPFFSTGLGIAVRDTGGGSGTSWAGAIEALFSWRFARSMGALLLVLFVVGLLIWLLERRKNAEQFGGGPVKGIGAGFWLSAVTMTTVGYGDKAPVTLGGRLVTLVWMFVSVVTISSFTAAIASSLTVERLGTSVEGPDDLPGVRVGSLQGTTSGNYLTSRHVPFRHYDSPLEALEGLANEEVDAVVYDQPLLRFHANGELRDQVTVLPVTFERQDYAIGLREGLPIREDLNRMMLSRLDESWWQDLMFRYMGRE